LTYFQNELEDAVGNVTLDANTRERRNQEKTRVRGVEAGAWWQPVKGLRVEADYAGTDARVRRGGPGLAGLEGRRLVQVPKHTLTAGVAWEAARWLGLDARGRWVSEQFEDDLNKLALAAALRVDLAVQMKVSDRLGVKVAVENVLDEEVETGRTAGGVVSVAPPRWVRVEVGYAW
jgi:outer membrane receptor protein involved in Fe transport